MKILTLLFFLIGVLFAEYPVMKTKYASCGSLSIKFINFNENHSDYKTKKHSIEVSFLKEVDSILFKDKNYYWNQNVYFDVAVAGKTILPINANYVSFYCMKEPSTNIDRMYILANTLGGNASIADLIVDFNTELNQYKIIYENKGIGTAKVVLIDGDEYLLYWDYGNKTMQDNDAIMVYHLKSFNTEKGFYTDVDKYSQNYLKKVYDKARFKMINNQIFD